MKVKIKNSIIYIVALSIAVIFAMDARRYMNIFVEGATIWAINVLPALLPFALLSKVLFSTNTTTAKKSTAKQTKVLQLSTSHYSTIVLAWICGYPIGAKLTAQLPTMTDTERRQKSMLVATCSTVGPIFLIGTVGASFLKNNSAIVILLLSTLLGAIVNGLIYSTLKCPINSNTFLSQNATQPQKQDSMLDSLLTVFCVGGYIAIFYVIAEMLRTLCQALPFANAINILSGILEMTGGCYYISQNFNTLTATVLCSALTAFGGICVLMQNMTYLKQCGYTVTKVLIMKLTQGILTGIFALLLALIML